MAPQGVQRKLTAILSADVVGYSRLMGDDEVTTIRTLTTYRDVMAFLIQQRRGRVVDFPGDNLLAEFVSVVDAVQCAVEIQRELKARNAELPDHGKMEFRIGINLGDVIVEGERIYGDGVNIAARIEGLAEAGGICISRSSFEQVRNKLSLGYQSLGKHAVKNIAEPVRVYRVLMDPEAAGIVIGEKRPPIALLMLSDIRARPWRWAALASVLALLVATVAVAVRTRSLDLAVDVGRKQTTAFPLPDKPSIAVLPFVNMSGELEQEYFGDGMTEDLITDLSKVSGIFVIASNSVFTYKGRPVKVQRVAKELGVRYVLEGSVRKVGDRIRISAQLADAVAGTHLWGERYDRTLKDVFAVQDEITQKIVAALAVKLTEGEQARMWHNQTGDLQAWGYFIRGRALVVRLTNADNGLARQMWEKAVELDPEYAAAWVGLAWTHWMDARWGWSKSRTQSIKRAHDFAQKALALDEAYPDTHALLGGIHLYQRQYEEAIAEGRRAVALGPNVAENHALLALTLLYSGRPEDAIAMVQKAMRLSPYYPDWYLGVLGHAHRLTGQYEEAIRAEKRRLERNPQSVFSNVKLAVIYSELGREEEARTQAAEVVRLNPNFSLEHLRKALLYEDQAERERFLDALRKVGLR